jgi:hypothetical protein
MPIDLLRNSGFVDFGDYFGRFSIFFCRGSIQMLIQPLQKKSKIGSKEPQNRQKLNFERGLTKTPS